MCCSKSRNIRWSEVRFAFSGWVCVRGYKKFQQIAFRGRDEGWENEKPEDGFGQKGHVQQHLGIQVWMGLDLSIGIS